MAHLVKKTPKAIFQELSDFEKRMLLYNSHPWSRNFKIQFFLTPEWYPYYSLVINCKWLGYINAEVGSTF